MDSMFQEHGNKAVWESSLKDDRSDREGNDDRVGWTLREKKEKRNFQWQSLEETNA